MRKFAVLPMAALLVLAIAAPAAAGANVQNTSGSATVINGEWYSESVSGSAYFATDSEYGSWGEVYEQAGEWVTCDDVGETYGFVGTLTYGWSSDLTIVIDSRLNHGTASGTIEMYSESINECTGENGGSGEGSVVAFTADLDGVGDVTRFRGSGGYKLPGEFNAHSSQTGKERGATGSIDFGEAGSRTFDYATLAALTWRDHANN